MLANIGLHKHTVVFAITTLRLAKFLTSVDTIHFLLENLNPVSVYTI